VARAARAGSAPVARLMNIFAAARDAVGEEPIAAGGRRALMDD